MWHELGSSRIYCTTNLAKRIPEDWKIYKRSAHFLDFYFLFNVPAFIPPFNNLKPPRNFSSFYTLKPRETSCFSSLRQYKIQTHNFMLMLYCYPNIASLHLSHLAFPCVPFSADNKLLITI